MKDIKEINKILDYMKQYVENIYDHDSEPILNWKDLKIVLDYIEQKKQALLDIKKYIEEEFCQIDNETKEIECWHERVEPIYNIVNKELGNKNE